VAQDPVWEAMASGVLRTGTGPTRLADWLPVQRPRPMLVEPGPESNRKASQTAVRPWTWVESAVLSFYALVVAVGIAWHEPWADEAQAWLLARDSGFWQMMLHGIRYEGSPGLWHTLLWVLVRLHVSFMGMHWIAGAIAVAGVYLLLRYSPFPLVLRVLLPFGFWFAYQDAVVARSYVLFAALAFGAAALLRGIAQAPARAEIPRSRWIGLAVLLGLMANVSVHGFVASLGFAVAAGVVLRRTRHAMGPVLEIERNEVRGRVVSPVIPMVVLAGFWVIAVATTLPPSDVNFQAGTNVEHSTERILARVGDANAKAAVAAETPEASDVRPGELTPVAPIANHWTPREALWRKVARVLSLITYPVSNFRILALLACGLVVSQSLRFQKGWSLQAGALGWTGLLPWALMVLVFTSMYLAPRHAGMLWTALIASTWLTWPTRAPASWNALWLQRAVVAALAVVAIQQAMWTALAVHADVHHAYAGDTAMAQFLKSKRPGKRVAGFYYYTVGAAAWFRHPIFFNQPHAYWAWSREVRTVQGAPATIATRPDVIVASGMEPSAHDANITDDWIAPNLAQERRTPLNDVYGIIPFAEAHGYRETHRFCGRSFMRAAYAEELCEVALEPAP
jgi:hypothetical protein